MNLLRCECTTSRYLPQEVRLRYERATNLLRRDPHYDR
jgi:hypothetical protein